MSIVVPEKSARQVIDENFPIELRSKFPKIINNAYFWAYRTLQNTSLLNWERGKSLLPHIKNIAVEFFLVQEIKNNNLPLSWRVSFTSNKSASLIELYNDDILLHINQVRNKLSIGRAAYCRNQHIQHFQSYINFENINDKNNTVQGKPKYFQLNHGYQSQEPLFISLGIPGTNKKWVDNIQLLDEFTVVEGQYPKSKPEDIKDFSLEEFQQFAEEVDKNESKATEK
ncbi:hypothetical protein LCD52_16095 [Rossellomorea vietnamensis]|uniref:hypothetical protein n=1 Tax=Rossellomorea vietnamensis TaxID=218284 RepID=UPI001CCB6B2D|nr:hypothetical protein [Rossellomorea vietnamensis]MCA0150306.1 hypothetical protein [Rossellomorea vietnamensis]